MNYHEPDTRWHIFQSISDFQSFSEKFVASGKFHSKVPDDVVKSYQVAEYIMAHSYYHYPMYDEALNKALRTLEMAIKFRCKELGISIETENPKKPRFPLAKYNLNELISKLNVAEPGKYDMHEMDSLRNLRNVFMHPDQHGFGGAAMTGLLFKMVVVLNKVFLPADYLKDASKLRDERNAHLKQFRNSPTIMTFQDVRYLIYEVSILDSLQVEDQENHLLYVMPLHNDASDLLTKHVYLPPWAFHINKIQIIDQKVIAKTIGSDEKVSFELTEHPSDIKKFQDFSLSLEGCSPTDQSIFTNFYDHKKQEEMNRFLYSYLWQI
jgi:hypothetical protein